MKRVMTVCAAALLILTGSGAFGATEKTSPLQAPPKTEPAENTPSGVSGKVVETMNAGGYTYVCLEKNGQKTWVAVPEMAVTVGETIAFQPGAEMTNFTSKTLKRTFERIIFSVGPLAKAGGDKAASVKQHGSKAVAAGATEKITVEKAAGANAYTIAEIFSKKTSLNKRKVVLRGKVVKFSSGIMGKNWIHLQDGTGNEQKGTNKLVVTSQDSASVGDVVTVTGTIYKNKDFGAGYKYDVIMEEASIQR